MLQNKKGYIQLLTVAITVALFSCSSAPTVNNPEIIKPVIEPPNPYAAVDKSPMDISYYPVNYPTQLMSGNDSGSLMARVIYSRPQKNGRVVFGSEAPPKCVQQYGAYWRLGANEASEIEFFRPAIIQGKKIPKGRYIIYCIPLENTWTIVLNTNLFSWGLHPDTAKDIAKFEIPVQRSERNIEFFTMVFQQLDKGAGLLMAWDNVKAVLPLSFEQ
ncbi:DUF2911 domain-containing protein [Ferruginibacter sp.]